MASSVLWSGYRDPAPSNTFPSAGNLREFLPVPVVTPIGTGIAVMGTCAFTAGTTVVSVQDSAGNTVGVAKEHQQNAGNTDNALFVYITTIALPIGDVGIATASSSNSTINCTGKTWTVNQWVGKTVTLYNGETATVTSNTATQLSVGTGLSSMASGVGFVVGGYIRLNLTAFEDYVAIWAVAVQSVSSIIATSHNHQTALAIGTNNVTSGTKVLGSSPVGIVGFSYDDAGASTPFAPSASALSGTTDLGAGWVWDIGQANARGQFRNVASPGTLGATMNSTATQDYNTFMAAFADAGAAVVPLVPLDPTLSQRAKGIYTDFAPPNLLTQKTLTLPPFIQEEVWPRTFYRGVYTDFLAPNLLTQGTLKLPPFVQKDDGARTFWKGIYTDFSPPNLLADRFLPPPPVAAVDLSQRVSFRWSALDFAAPNLLPLTLVAVKPLAPLDISQRVASRWPGSDFTHPNLLLGILPPPPTVPTDAAISIRAKGVFTDFSPPNLTLSTLVPLAPARPQDISGIRLEYRWIRGDIPTPNLLLNTLSVAPLAPLLPQDISGLRLEARGLRSDFTPPNLTLFLPVPPPQPISAPAGRHGSRVAARRRRQLDVARAKVDAFKVARAEAEQALLTFEDREVRERTKVMKRIKVHGLRKPVEQYAPVVKAIAQRNVAMDHHRAILEHLARAQLEHDRIDREIQQGDEDAVLYLMQWLMMHTEWDNLR